MLIMSGLLEQGVKGYEFHSVNLSAWLIQGIIGDAPAVEATHTLGESTADATHAHDTYCLAWDAMDGHPVGVVPVGALGVVNHSDSLTHQGQHEGHGVICYLVHAVVRDVAYLYPHLGGRDAVDVIYPHTITDNHFQFGAQSLDDPAGQGVYWFRIISAPFSC